MDYDQELSKQVPTDLKLRLGSLSLKQPANSFNSSSKVDNFLPPIAAIHGKKQSSATERKDSHSRNKGALRVENTDE